MAGARYIGFKDRSLRATVLLSKQGADMNKRDRPDAWQPLHVTIKFGHFHIVRFLVETCECNIRSRTRNRMTALHWTAATGNVGIAKYNARELQLI